MDAVALIVAGGRGERLGGAQPKQYLPLDRQPMIRHSLATFARHPRIDAVRAVIHPDDRALYDAAASGLDLLAPVDGAADRQGSCRNGLESLAEFAPRRVLIHDAARPFVDAAAIDRVLDALASAPAAIPALPVNDTIKRAAADGRVAATVDRSSLRRAQTPQGFDYALILAAHRAAAGQVLTDDAAVAEAAGMAVALVAGSEANMKITTQDDLRRVAQLTSRGGGVRVGTGFDVHRFGPGDGVVLCGVSIPHDRAIVGHSDGDVGLHALTDAILGGLGAGDIGGHFPSSDARWRGADSALFLQHAAGLLREAGGRICHVDVTLICERPKLAAHRAAMVTRVAALLDTDPTRVSIKATTTDGLGFTGRGEGIAAQAVATLECLGT